MSAKTSPQLCYFWIDRGGTFTVAVARSPDGTPHPRRLRSENPEARHAIAGRTALLIAQ
jgi:N-methylhydantoinase A/oxoprolinase/acetone carboxylase beta subunit